MLFKSIALLSLSSTVYAQLCGRETEAPAIPTTPNIATLSVTPTVNAASDETWHLGTTVSNSENQNISINRPTNDAREGDSLFLFMSRTDDVLPLTLPGWTTVGSCFKTDNGDSECQTTDTCETRNADDPNYCDLFESPNERGNGRDLATVVYWKRMGPNEPLNYEWTIEGDQATWGVLSAFRLSDPGDNPVRSIATESCDDNERNPSYFPSTNGLTNDILVLSQCFDDPTEKDDFEPPEKTELSGWVTGKDQASYVFSKRLDADGPTGQQVTAGPGGSGCKDALISMVLKA